MSLIEANWPVAALIGAMVLAVLFMILRRSRKVRVRYRAPDALDDGAAPAHRNQALIDAPVATVQAMPAGNSDAGSDLARIKGLGPKLQALLPTLGVTSLAQIAAWTDEDLARIDAQLGAFAGRPQRDSWIEQAKYLTGEDIAGFEAKFGKL